MWWQWVVLPTAWGLVGSSVFVRVGSCLKGGIVQQVLLCLDLQAKYVLAKECRYLPICRPYEGVAFP